MAGCVRGLVASAGGGYALYVLLVMTLTFLVNTLDRYLLGTVSADIERDVGFGDGEGGGFEYQILAGPVFIVIFTIAGIPIGHWADVGDRPLILSLSVALWCGATALSGAATKYWQLVLLRALMGIGQSGALSVNAGLLAECFPARHLSTALGVYTSGLYVGYGMSYVFGNFISPWRVAFYAAGAPGALLAPLVYFTIREPRRGDKGAKTANGSTGERKKQGAIGRKGYSSVGDFYDGVDEVSVVDPTDCDDARSTEGKESLSSRDIRARDDVDAAVGSNVRAAPTSRRYSLWESVRFFFTARSLVVLVVAGAIRNAAGYVWALNTQQYLHVHRDIPKDDIGVWMAWIPPVGGSIGAALGGIIADRVGRNGALHRRVWVLVLSQLAGAPFAAGVMLLPYPYNFVVLLPGYVVGEMWIGVTLAVVVELVPAPMCATAVSIYSFVINNVGGNANVLVPPIESASSLTVALLIIYPGFYVLSSVIFLGSIFSLKRDAQRAVSAAGANDESRALLAGDPPDVPE